MRTTLVCLLGVLLPGPVCAQRPAPTPAQTPEEELEAKLASPFLEKAHWLLDFDEARATAKRTGKLIFGYFTTAGY